MRGIRARTSLVLLAATVAVGLAGCSDDPRKPGASGSDRTASPSASAGTGGESASPGPGSGTPGALPPDEGGGTATGSDIEVCAAQERLVAESTRKFGEEVVKAATSEGGSRRPSRR